MVKIIKRKMPKTSKGNARRRLFDDGRRKSMKPKKL